MATIPKSLRVDSAENQVLRQPGGMSDDPQTSPEVREDARLLALTAEGNQQAFAALYRRRGGIIYSLLMRMLVNETDAQEVLQDAFVLIWRRAHEYDGRRSSPLAWMIMLARGLALDRLRARSRRAATHAAYEREVASLEFEQVNGTGQAERDETAAACATALHQLPESQSRALQLAFLRGWTHEEIAAVEGEPLGTVKARIRRGLFALRKILRDYHG